MYLICSSMKEKRNIIVVYDTHRLTQFEEKRKLNNSIGLYIFYLHYDIDKMATIASLEKKTRSAAVGKIILRYRRNVTNVPCIFCLFLDYGPPVDTKMVLYWNHIHMPGNNCCNTIFEIIFSHWMPLHLI